MSVAYEPRAAGHDGPAAGDGRGNGHDDGRHLLAHQFENLPQQRDVASLGMWVFLASEILFFGGLFTAYTVYRNSPGNQLALGSAQLDEILGAIAERLTAGALGCDDERQRVDAEAADAQLDPGLDDS